MSEEEFQVINRNQLAVANRGRQPGLELEHCDGKIPLKDCALEILTAMKEVCHILDGDTADKPYASALASMEHLVLQPERTPSARMLAIMTETGLPFSRFAVQKSLEHAAYFADNPPAPELVREYDELSQKSLAKQAALETDSQLPFDEFLARYFAQ
jgi:glutamate--cysteine ligase